MNTIPVEELTDQHLMAEYREIRHVGPSLRRSQMKKGGFSLDEVPTDFTLNTGHVKFFYTKGKFLAERFKQLRDELVKRGFNLNEEIGFDTSFFQDGFYNDWTPTEESKRLIRERIKERIEQKPGFYRYKGERID